MTAYLRFPFLFSSSSSSSSSSSYYVLKRAEIATERGNGGSDSGSEQ